VPADVHEVLGSPGQPLDSGTRAFMEPRFGRDFGNVRVHTDIAAAESARAINAIAYTVGSDVIFAHRMYAPHSGEGRKLLAHELTHVMQGQVGIASASTIVRRAVDPNAVPPAASASPAVKAIEDAFGALRDLNIQSLSQDTAGDLDTGQRAPQPTSDLDEFLQLEVESIQRQVTAEQQYEGIEQDVQRINDKLFDGLVSILSRPPYIYRYGDMLGLGRIASGDFDLLLSGLRQDAPEPGDYPGTDNPLDLPQDADGGSDTSSA
jgi:hypothetical protein